MTDSIVSVIVPVYNVEQYLAKCVESILCQTYHNLDIILINDGSTDKSLEIAQSFVDPRIRIINKENSGQSDCRYLGYHESKGDFLFFMDSDDTLDSNAIRDLYDHITAANADMCCCRFCLIDDSGKELKISEPYLQDILDNNTIILKEALISGQIKGTLWTKLFRKSFLEKNGLEPERRIKLHDDCMFSFLTAVFAERVCFTQSVLYKVLQRPNSISRTCKPIMVTVYQDIYEILHELLSDTGKYDIVKNQFYAGYCKSVLYALILAAVRSENYNKFLNIYEAIGKEDYYYSNELIESLPIMPLKIKVLYRLSRIKRLFYFVVSCFSSFFNH